MMFLSHEAPDHACSSAADCCSSTVAETTVVQATIAQATVAQGSVTSQASSHQGASSTVESDSESYEAFVSDRELRLQAFIQKAHQMSRSGKYPSVMALQLLDRAWEAQKLLWSLRQNQTKTPLQEDWVCKSWVYRSR